MELGISLDQVSPQLDLWSDASDMGWRAHLGQEVTSGRWSPEELAMSINARELLAIERALLFFAPQIRNSSVAVFADNSMGDSVSSQPGRYEIPAAECHRAAGSAVVGVSSVTVAPQFILGRHNVVADSVSPQPSVGLGMDSQDRGFSRAPEEVAGVHRPFCHLTQSPVLSIFFTIPRSERAGHGCSAPELEWVAGVCLSSLVTHSSGAQEAPVVIWRPPDHHSSVLASAALVSGPSGSGCGRSGGSASITRSSTTATLSSSSSGSVRAAASCLETIQRFA